MATPLPEKFLSRFGEIFGVAQARELGRTFVERPTTFRVNTLQADVNTVLDTLSREGFKIKRVPWTKTGFILASRTQRELVKLPLYLNGDIYLQSLASQVPVMLMGITGNERILDMTAAPGSKTSQIVSELSQDGTVLACERDKVRFERLKHNMKLLCSKFTGGVELRCCDALRLGDDQALLESFDKILLDAPCSAEARIIERDKRTFGYWSEDNIKSSSALQLKLLQVAFKLLKRGGELVYSTCTFAPEENELLLDYFYRQYPKEMTFVPSVLPNLKVLGNLKKWQKHTISEAIKGIRIIPTLEIEGFFVAKIKKN